MLSNTNLYKEHLKTAWVFMEKKETYLRVLDVTTNKKIEYHRKSAKLFASFVTDNPDTTVVRSYVTDDI